MGYKDFEVKFVPQGEKRFRVEVESPAGDGTEEFDLPFDEAELADLMDNLSLAVAGAAGAVPPEAAFSPEVVGGRLFEWLFRGQVRALFERSLGMTAGPEEAGLRVRLCFNLGERPDLAWLASLPWEFLYRRETRKFLSLSVGTPVVRYLEVPLPPEPLRLKKPLRILFVLASPIDRPDLELEQEVESIVRTLAARHKPESVEFRVLAHATVGDLLRELDGDTYHVVHFMGHGGFDKSGGILCLEDGEGRTDPVTSSQLVPLLSDRKSVRLVFLNACETAAPVEAGERYDATLGLAPALVLGGMTAVVAMQFPISDEAAKAFSEELYSHLARGRPVDEAVSRARKLVQASTDGREWGTPVLYMRTSDGRLFDEVEAEPAGVPPEAAGVAAPLSGAEAAEEGAPGAAEAGRESAGAGPGLLQIGPLAVSRRAALGIGLGVLLLTIALVAGWLLLRPRPVSYVELILDNGPAGGEQGLAEIGRAVEEELRRALPDTALALRVFGPRCGETVRVVDFARGNAGEVMAALLEVQPAPEAPLVEAVRQGLNDVLGRPGNVPKAVIGVTWGEDTCGGDLARTLEAYRGQLGSAVHLYLVPVGAAAVPRPPYPEGVEVVEAGQAQAALRRILTALGAGRLPTLPPPSTATVTPSVTPSPTPTATPSATASVTPSRTPTATPTPSPTASATPAATASATPAATASATATATASATPTATASLPENLDQPWNVAWRGLGARGRAAMGLVIATGERLTCTRQEFRYGFLFWCDRQHGKHRTGPERPDMIFAVEYRGRHRAWAVEDTWTADGGEVDCPVALPEDWPALSGGFRQVWCEQRDIRTALEEPVEEALLLPKLAYGSYGTGPGVMEFEGGYILWDTDADKLWALPDGLAWQSFELKSATPAVSPSPTVLLAPEATETLTVTLSPSPTP